MTPQETATNAASEIANAQQIKLASATLLSVDEIAAIILTRYAPLEQELEDYKAVAKELAEYGNELNENHQDFLHLLAGHAPNCDCDRCESFKMYKATLTKFNNLEAKDKKG